MTTESNKLVLKMYQIAQNDPKEAEELNNLYRVCQDVVRNDGLKDRVLIVKLNKKSRIVQLLVAFLQKTLDKMVSVAEDHEHIIITPTSPVSAASLEDMIVTFAKLSISTK